MLKEPPRQNKFIKALPFNALKAQARCLHGTETNGKRIGSRGDLALLYAALQFLNAINRDVLMNIIMSLTSQTLQQKLSVYARFFAQSVSGKAGARPLVLILPHPYLHTHIALLVLLVEVGLLMRSLLSDSSGCALFFNVLGIQCHLGMGEPYYKKLHRMANPEEVHHSEQHKIGTEQQRSIAQCRI